MSDDFCTGVKILLSRMESNPEEFVYVQDEPNRWHEIIQSVTGAKLARNSQHDTLTVDEVNALYDGMVVARRKAFDDSIMRDLLKDEEELSHSFAKASKRLRLSQFQIQTAKQAKMSPIEYAKKLASLEKTI